jgi:hypothetical protein
VEPLQIYKHMQATNSGMAILRSKSLCETQGTISQRAEMGSFSKCVHEWAGDDTQAAKYVCNTNPTWSMMEQVLNGAVESDVKNVAPLKRYSWDVLRWVSGKRFRTWWKNVVDECFLTGSTFPHFGYLSDVNFTYLEQDYKLMMQELTEDVTRCHDIDDMVTNLCTAVIIGGPVAAVHLTSTPIIM